MKLEHLSKNYIFPLLLLLFALLHINKGVDLTDSGFSLAGYVFFRHADAAFALNIYLSNVIGFCLTLLPFGQYMLAMNVYSSLLVFATALIAYRFFITKMPAWVAFISLAAAIGLAWCPSVILYNYLSYCLFLLAAILIFRALVGFHPACLVIAGALLGLNVYVRNPNILQAGLIVCVWYYAWLRKKSKQQVMKETLLCLAGYVTALLAMTGVMMISHGSQAPLNMLRGLMGIADSNASYSIFSMIGALFEAYLTSAKWLFYMALCILPGIPFLMIKLSGLFGNKIAEDSITILKKIAYSLAIALLFYGFFRLGMYNFKFYQKDAALQWATVFILISLVNMVYMLCSKTVDVHWKLIAALGIAICLITPLGSNNNVWPLINNLFFVAPITVWRAYLLARYGRRFVGSKETPVPLFPLKAMQMGIVCMFIIMSLGVGSFYVFRDGEDGKARQTPVSGNEILRGMRTNAENAANLAEITAFLQASPQYDGHELILYGNIPGLSYCLNRPSAISVTWPDLDSYGAARFEEELAALSAQIEVKGHPAPLLILNTTIPERPSVQEKLVLLEAFMEGLDYGAVFENQAFVLYAIR